MLSHVFSSKRPSSRPESQHSEIGSLEFEDFEDEVFHDCIEMDTLYLSFDNQDVPYDIPNNETSTQPLTQTFNETNHDRSQSEPLLSNPSFGSTTDGETASNGNPSPSLDDVIQPERNLERRPSIEEKRRQAFALRRVDSFQGDGESMGPCLRRLPDHYETPSFNLLPLEDRFSERFNGTEASPDVLVTLTTTGISAKREDPFDPSRVTKSHSLTDGWNIDSIPDSSIFDKARLVEEALDTADINKCMAPKSDRYSKSPLPSLTVQEQYSDELRNITKNHYTSSSSLGRICPSLPSYRMESVHSESGMIRAHSAPTSLKGIGVTDEDVEISSIMGHSVYYQPENRPMSSLSEPFSEFIQMSQKGGKKCLTTWVQKKIHFVSFDTESDAASITRSEYIMDMKRGKERREREGQRSRFSSQSTINSFAIGPPCVSPVPAGGIRDFNREDAIALNASLRNDPQLVNIPMGEWTSKLIGFATPADYYVHMIHELSSQKINVLALIKARLGDHHPLVTEIIEKLKNYTTEVPSFILGGPMKGHRRTPPLASQQKISLFSKACQDDYRSVETALVNCGVSLSIFEKTRNAFATDSEYYDYLSWQIKSSGIIVTIRKLKEHLGEKHPFVDIFRSRAVMEMESGSRTGSLTDSARSIQSGTPKSSPRVTPSPRSFRNVINHIQPGHSANVVRNECEAASGVFCGTGFFFCLPLLRRRPDFTRKSIITEHHLGE